MMRLPGGVPIGVPVPQIKPPKKEGKTDEKSAPKSEQGALKMTLRAVPCYRSGCWSKHSFESGPANRSAIRC